MKNYHDPLSIAAASPQESRPKFQSSNVCHFHNFSNFEKIKKDPLLFFDEEYVSKTIFPSVAYWRSSRARRTRRTRHTDIISEFYFMNFYIDFIIIFARIRIFNFQGTAILSCSRFAVARK